MPNSLARIFAMAPAATLEAVSRALALSKISLASLASNLSSPAKSACPGRGQKIEGSVSILKSLFLIRRAMGLPNVFPFLVPARISTLSFSISILFPRPKPFMRLVSSSLIKPTSSLRPLGIPSMIETSAFPCDSPAVRYRICITSSYIMKILFRISFP